MKLLKFLATGAIVASLSLTSCTADEGGPEIGGQLWQGELGAPEYADDAICYDLTDAPYSYIELSESGLYFVGEKAGNQYSAPMHRTMHKAPAASRSYYEPEIISGEYEKLSDGSYKLNGFGTITYNRNHTLSVTLENGESEVWDATPQEKMPTNALNSRLCRTWKIDKVRIEFCDKDNEVLKEVYLTEDQIATEYVNYFTFTYSGQVYEYDEGEWCLDKWSWYNATSQLIRIVNMDEEFDQAEGLIQAIFNDDRVTFLQPLWFDDSEEAEWEYEEILPNLSLPSSVRMAKEYLECKEYKIRK